MQTSIRWNDTVLEFTPNKMRNGTKDILNGIFSLVALVLYQNNKFS